MDSEVLLTLLEAAVIERGEQQRERQAGFTIVELLMVALIVLVIGGWAILSFWRIWKNEELRAGAAEIADTIQRARMLAAKDNSYYPVRYTTSSGSLSVFVDKNNDNTLDSGDPVLDLPNTIQAASGAPTSNPTPYTLATDTTSGTPYDNTNVLAFSPRGLPCEYSAPPTCATPASTYFVYYFQDGRPDGWAAVLVTKAGRTKVLLWNGSSWQ